MNQNTKSLNMKSGDKYDVILPKIDFNTVSVGIGSYLYVYKQMHCINYINYYFFLPDNRATVSCAVLRFPTYLPKYVFSTHAMSSLSIICFLLITSQPNTRIEQKT